MNATPESTTAETSIPDPVRALHMAALHGAIVLSIRCGKAAEPWADAKGASMGWAFHRALKQLAKVDPAGVRAFADDLLEDLEMCHYGDSMVDAATAMGFDPDEWIDAEQDTGADPRNPSTPPPMHYLWAIEHSVGLAIQLAKESNTAEAALHVDAIERLTAAYRAEAGEVESAAVHRYFGASYSNYLVVPRTLLQSMPDWWQAAFVCLLDHKDELFGHVPQAQAYEVTAATERVVSELGPELLAEAGITESWHGGQTPSEGLSDAALTEWKLRHTTDQPTYIDSTGREIDPSARVLIAAKEPVPHYDRGRTRVEPRLGNVG
jgi:hypothetical protein